MVTVLDDMSDTHFQYSSHMLIIWVPVIYYYNSEFVAQKTKFSGKLLEGYEMADDLSF